LKILLRKYITKIRVEETKDRDGKVTSRREYHYVLANILEELMQMVGPQHQFSAEAN
jgi:tRNA U55 pseudouridine synthase TruB